MSKKPAKNKLLKAFAISAALLTSSNVMSAQDPVEDKSVSQGSAIEQVDVKEAKSEPVNSTMTLKGKSRYDFKEGGAVDKFRYALADWENGIDKLTPLFNAIDEKDLEKAGLDSFDEDDMAYLDQTRKGLFLKRDIYETPLRHREVDDLIVTLKSHDAGTKALNTVIAVGVGVAALALLGGAALYRRRKQKPAAGVSNGAPSAGVSNAPQAVGASNGEGIPPSAPEEANSRTAGVSSAAKSVTAPVPKKPNM